MKGYAANAVMYRCIRLVAEALKGVPVQVFDGDKDVTETHELANVLANPNPQQIWEELVDSMVLHLFLAGEEVLEGVTVRQDKVLAALAEQGRWSSSRMQAAGRAKLSLGNIARNPLIVAQRVRLAEVRHRRRIPQDVERLHQRVVVVGAHEHRRSPTILGHLDALMGALGFVDQLREIGTNLSNGQSRHVHDSSANFGVPSS